MKKIFISITYIKESGGISTSLVNLLNEIHEHYDITLCVPTNYIASRYTLPENIKIIPGSNYLRDIVCSRKQLSYQKGFNRFLRNSRRIFNRYILKNKGIELALSSIKINGIFDVALAFADFSYDVKNKLCYDYFIVDKLVKAKRKIAWMHSNPEQLGWTPELIHKRLNGFDYIVNVSENCKKIFDKICPSYIQKSKVVLNTYNIQEINEKSLQYKNNIISSEGQIKLLTVSRVEIKYKRHDRIVEVCSRLKEEGYSNFEWTIVGDGGALKMLKERAAELKLGHMLNFVGHKDNPYPYMAQADAFILCSEYEGYGMTIKEAQILRCPTFVTGFGAAEEVVDNYVNGEICDNSTEGLFEMIKGILENTDKLKQYRNNLRKQPITNDIAVNQFEELCK